MINSKVVCLSNLTKMVNHSVAPFLSTTHVFASELRWNCTLNGKNCSYFLAGATRKSHPTPPNGLTNNRHFNASLTFNFRIELLCIFVIVRNDWALEIAFTWRMYTVDASRWIRIRVWIAKARFRRASAAQFAKWETRPKEWWRVVASSTQAQIGSSIARFTFRRYNQTFCHVFSFALFGCARITNCIVRDIFSRLNGRHWIVKSLFQCAMSLHLRVSPNHIHHQHYFVSFLLHWISAKCEIDQKPAVTEA